MCCHLCKVVNISDGTFTHVAHFQLLKLKVPQLTPLCPMPKAKTYFCSNLEMKPGRYKLFSRHVLNQPKAQGNSNKQPFHTIQLRGLIVTSLLVSRCRSIRLQKSSRAEVLTAEPGLLALPDVLLKRIQSNVRSYFTKYKTNPPTNNLTWH